MPLFDNDPPESTDNQYKLLFSVADFGHIKDSLESMWNLFEPYADRNFKSEIKINFQDRFWEMYLGSYFLKNKFRLNERKGNAGPDISICHPKSIYIEATTPANANGPDNIPQPELEKVTEVPHEKKILRYCSSIKEKYKKYGTYIAKEIISINEPYVIAINGFKLPHKYSDIYPPDIVRAVLPFGDEVGIINLENNQIVDSYFEFRPNISKYNKRLVSTTIFSSSDFSEISGIIFSYANAFNLPNIPGADLIFIHNPYADHPLEKGWLLAGEEYWVDNGELKHCVI